VLLPMMVGSVLTATVGGQLIIRFSYRSIMFSTLLLLLCGIFLLTTLSPESTRLELTLYMILVGLGIGASFSVLSNACIHGLTYQQRGTASSTFNFLRSLGMTLGITMFGMIQNHTFSQQMNPIFSGNGALSKSLRMDDLHMLLSEQNRSRIPAEAVHSISEALSSSITHTFVWAIIPVLLACAASLLMGRSKLDAEAVVEEFAPHAERG